MGLRERSPFNMGNKNLDTALAAANQKLQKLPTNLDMTTVAGQQAYKSMTKEQRAAFDAKQQQKNLTKAEQDMLGILNQAPKYKSAMQSPEFSQFKAEAYGTGPLAEYEAMRKQAGLAREQGQRRVEQGTTDELQNLSLSQAGQAANAYSQMAQSGGLSGGSRERMAASLGNQALQSRQAARLQGQRQGMDLESQYQQGLMDLMGKEAGARRGMQNTYMDMLAKDVAGQSAYEQSMFGKKADVQAGLAKARMDAQMNAYRK